MHDLEQKVEQKTE
jgi:hypothetical protein